MKIEDKINTVLVEYNVAVKFCRKAVDDLLGYDRNQQSKIVALIIKRGKSGPLFKPRGLGEPLRNKSGQELKGFTKIKPKKMNMRIIYSPMENGKILMGIIAIGPRDKEKVYKEAAKRVPQFEREMREA
ncbi:hypothetical protein ABE178_25370 [Priestia megaterium]